MIHFNTLGNGLKRGIVRFSAKVSKNFSKPVRKFITDMVYGIIASESCMLTKIGRALKEDISLKKVVDRLGRQLSHFTGTDELLDRYLEAVRPSFGEDTMLIIDPSDVTKPCSPKMEAIGSVWDASEKAYGMGYWTMGAVALTGKTNHPVPVYEQLYPCKKQGGKGLVEEADILLQFLRERFDNNIPRVFDRGFDSGDVMKALTGYSEKFIIRQCQNRIAIHNGKSTLIANVIKDVVCRHEMRYRNKDGKKVTCKIGMTTVELPNLKNITLNLVVCKGAGENPLVLYTNLEETVESIAVRVVKAYLMRWRIDEMYGYKKKSLNFEDFRVRSLNSIKALDILLTVAVGYLGTLCDKVEEDAFVMELIYASQRVQKPRVFLKTTKFIGYALLDGITAVLGKLRCGIKGYFATPPPSRQLCLPGFVKLG